MSALAVIDLPLPDSPTMPIVSPGARLKSEPTVIKRSVSCRRLEIRSPLTVSNGEPSAARAAVPGWLVIARVPCPTAAHRSSRR